MFRNDCTIKRPFVYTKEQFELFELFRALWEQHSTWTRAAIVSLSFDLANQDAVVNRLLQNPTDFMEVLTAFYGEDEATEFEKLLTEHLVLAAQIIQATKVGDSEEAVQAEKMWYANGNEIARFLGRVNPFWSTEQWKLMMKEHLDHVKAEATYMLTGQHEEAVTVYDYLEQQALKMADEMAIGLIRQFHI